MASSYLSLTIHVVFATKGRAPWIDDDWMSDLHGYIGGTLRGLGAIPIAVGGVADHVHLLVGLKATHSVADLVREVKKASSVWASSHRDGFAWQGGYGAFSVGRGELGTITNYIATQPEHHRSLSSADELRALLAEHGVPYDERYFE